MRVVEFVHSVVTGSRRRRDTLTAGAFAVFSVVVVGVVMGALFLDERLGVALRLSRQIALSVGLPVLILGASLVAWCILAFRAGRGTPVPFSPPRALVVRGAYKVIRNPMLTGLFAALIGAGLVLRSPCLLFGLVPLVVAGASAELMLVEEPELEKRFGAAYADYRRRVPMFVPRLGRRAAARPGGGR